MLGRQGGLEIYNSEVVNVLRVAGVKLRVISALDSDSIALRDLVFCGLAPRNRVLRRVYARIWQRLLWIHLAARARQFELAIAAHISVAPAVYAHSRRAGKPFCVLAFGLDVWRTWTRLETIALESATRIIAISTFTAQTIAARLADGDRRLTVIHPCVDVTRFRPAPSRPAIDADRFVILTVGRLASGEQYKGHDLIIRALPVVERTTTKRVEHWIVGDGDDRPRLQSIADGCNVADRVRFLGRASDRELVDLYHQCDVFAMPSFVSQRSDGSFTGEGFGIVYLEAAACGKPIVAADVGGQTDIVVDGETGLLVEPTVADVARALGRLAEDKALREGLGRRARQVAEERFGLEQFSNTWVDLVCTHLA